VWCGVVSINLSHGAIQAAMWRSHFLLSLGSSGEGNYTNVKPVQYGWYYRLMITDILTTLGDLSSIVPDYDEEQGYELAGFVWFQGYSDFTMGWPAIDEYGPNLANFIRDVRLDLDVPNLPFVIGELGMHGEQPQGEDAQDVLAMRAHQHSVTLLEEFRNNTLFVRTAPYAVLNETQYTGIYHYFGKYLVKEATCMVALLQQSNHI
jgi:hypothetical protein